MYCYTQCPQPCSRPLLTQASTGESGTSTGKSGTVSCGVTAPFFWVLVHGFLLCPPRVYFPVLCKFWQLYDGVYGDLLQEGLCHEVMNPETLSLRQTAADQYLHSRCSNIVLSQSLWGPWVLVHTSLFDPSEHLW